MYVQRNTEARSRNHCCRGKAIFMCVRARTLVRVPWSVGVCMGVRACSLTYPECNAMRHTVTSFEAPLAVPYFPTLSHKWHDFRKKLLDIKCVFRFSLQLLSKSFLILRRIWRDTVINVRTSSCKVPVILVAF